MTIPFAQPAWAGLAIAALAAVAPAQNTASRPKPFALRGVRLDASEEAPRKTLLLRDGRITSILPGDAQVPADAWVVEADGLVAAPAFIDAWATELVTAPEVAADQDRPVDVAANVRVDMRAANRKGVAPSFDAADAIALTADRAEGYRKSGFGLALAAPDGLLLGGSSAVVTLRDAAPRDLVVQGDVLQHASFRGARGGYPGTLMAYHAQLRQFFYDAERHRVLRERWRTGKPGPRPAWDPELDAGVDLLAGAALVCEAQTARDVNRWMRLLDELGLNLALIAGGRDAWKVADALAARDVTVVLDLDWGDEPDLPEEEAEESEEEGGDEPAAEPDPFRYSYREPRAVSEEKHRLWTLRRDSALRLYEAGVRLLFGTGDRDADDLLEGVRTLVANGLPREAAMAALTAHPAEVFGVDRHYGWLRAGASATLTLWSGDPLAEGSQVVWSFVDGYPLEFEQKEESGGGEAPDEGVDLTGTWKVEIDGEDDRPMILTLTMNEEGAVEGKVDTTNPMDGSALSTAVTGHVSGTDVELSMTFTVGPMEVEVVIEGEVDGDRMTGTSTVKLPGNEQESEFEATRQPGGAQ